MKLQAKIKKVDFAVFSKNTFLKEIFRARYLYLLILPCIIHFFIFNYIPMYGLSLAFKRFNPTLGMTGSPFIGLENYTYVFQDPAFFLALKNTLVISLCRILFQFPFPIILALMINELWLKRYKRVLQTIFTLPNFLSWVIVSSLMINLLKDTGAINALLESFGLAKIQFLARPKTFVPLLYLTENWKSTGWSAIIYLAAIAGISNEQYEAAHIDGASQLQKLIYITLPGIKSTIVVLLILAFGNMMSAGFDQIFNMYNPAVYNASDILDTYIYRVTFQSPTDFGFSTAIGLFKSVINFILLIICDRIAKIFGERGLYY